MGDNDMSSYGMNILGTKRYENCDSEYTMNKSEDYKCCLLVYNIV